METTPRERKQEGQVSKQNEEEHKPELDRWREREREDRDGSKAEDENKTEKQHMAMREQALHVS